MSLDILVILTSHDQLGDTGEQTGLWLEEFAGPYYRLTGASARLTIASPKGGRPPVDPKSRAPDAQTEATRRFAGDAEAQEAFGNSLPLAEVQAGAYDAVFFPGGHGPLWDLTTNEKCIDLIESFLAQEKPVAAVCHGPAVLTGVTTPMGEPIVSGRRVTGFSNSEEAAAGLTDVVPFLLEDRLIELGAKYERGEDWASHVVADGLLITGQNPASSVAVADKLLHTLA